MIVKRHHSRQASELRFRILRRSEYDALSPLFQARTRRHSYIVAAVILAVMLVACRLTVFDTAQCAIYAAMFSAIVPVFVTATYARSTARLAFTAFMRCVVACLPTRRVAVPTRLRIASVLQATIEVARTQQVARARERDVKDALRRALHVAHPAAFARIVTRTPRLAAHIPAAA